MPRRREPMFMWILRDAERGRVDNNDPVDTRNDCWVVKPFHFSRDRTWNNRRDGRRLIRHGPLGPHGPWTEATDAFSSRWIRTRTIFYIGASHDESLESLKDDSLSSENTNLPNQTSERTKEFLNLSLDCECTVYQSLFVRHVRRNVKAAYSSWIGLSRNNHGGNVDQTSRDITMTWQSVNMT